MASASALLRWALFTSFTILCTISLCRFLVLISFVYDSYCCIIMPWGVAFRGVSMEEFFRRDVKNSWVGISVFETDMLNDCWVSI